MEAGAKLAVMLYVLLGAAPLSGCGQTQSNAASSRSGGAPTFAPEPAADGGLAMPSSTRRGVMVPSDTGLGATPAGSAASTGTSGASMGRQGNTNGTGN